MTPTSTQSEPTNPRRRRRLLKIVLLTTIGTIVLWLFLQMPYVWVARGYLQVAQGHGYAYDLRRFAKDYVLWQSVRPASLVLWKAARPPAFGENLTVDGRHLAGRRLQEPNEKVAYALQPDYTAKEIPLSAQEADQAFALVEKAIQNGTLQPDEFWTNRIEPELKLVGTEAAATVPADESQGTE